MDILKNKWIGYGAVLAIAGLLFYVWLGMSSSDELLSTSGEDTSPLSQELLTTLSQLNSIKLDPTFFSDPAFLSLNDFSTTIPAQNTGRRNPFEPVQGSSVRSSVPAQ